MSRATPRLGFLGIGWIGLARMQAILEEEAGEVTAIADPDADAIDRARAVAPDAAVVDGLEGLLACDLDGIVIATPSAMHAAQAVAALERGRAVFCQKPLGRTGPEVTRIVDAAAAADRLLAVDLSYRHTDALRQVRDRIRTGALGRIYAMDLTFHNAWGPDKPWFRDPERSGGGCVVDLGIHLVDAALWMLDFPAVRDVRSRLFAQGRALGPDPSVNEDFAVAELLLDDDVVVRLTCSWDLPAGKDAVIEVATWGTEGGAAMRNVDGSFYDFVAEHTRGTSVEVLAMPPDAWGGRAAVAWARRLAADPSYDPEVAHAVDVARTLDRIYGRS